MTQPLILPSYNPPAGSWGLTDWLDQSWTSAPAATGSGQCRVAVPQLPQDVRWLITRAVVSSTSTAAPESRARFYLNDVGTGNLRTGSDSGDYDEADYPRGLMVPPSCALIVVWTGVSDGAVATLALQAEIYRPVF